MLQFDNSAEGLFHPGRGPYFDGLALNLVPFEPQRQDYSARNAWWLAELSRLVYRGGVAPNDVVLQDRPTVLQNAGMREVAFFSRGGTEVGIVSAPNFNVLVFRGTDELPNWLQNINVRPIKWPDGKGRVHAGFKSALELVWTDVASTLQKVKGPLFIAGHSLGAALAVLAGARLGRDGVARAVYAYGCPRAGDPTFADNYPPNVQVHRIVNDNDAVATVPLALMGYKHVGIARYITEDGRLVTGNKEGLLLANRLLGMLKALEANPHLPLPDCLTDHNPVNYVAWMQRLAKT